MRFDLIIPYKLKDEIKKNHKIRWDAENKNWFIEVKNKGDLPEELTKYLEEWVDIEYDRKDEFKEKFTSLSWSPIQKKWRCSAEDFIKIEKYINE